MSFSRTVKIILFFILALIVSYEYTLAQTEIDTLKLVKPDSVYLRREGRSIIIGWYPAPDSISAHVGSNDFTQWYGAGVTNCKVDAFGTYTDFVDRSIRFEKMKVRRDTVGVTKSLVIVAETRDHKDTYRQSIDIGEDYNPGDTVRVILEGQAQGKTLDIGLCLAFQEGYVDTGAYFIVDVQDFEGFNIWRGFKESQGDLARPVDLAVVEELSKEDAYLGVDVDSIYFDNFEEWPKIDADDRYYYELVDDNVYPGFNYFYIVTTFDRGYFKGFDLFNKRDNLVCGIDIRADSNRVVELACDEVKVISMTVDASLDIREIFAVPNPYRSGTSAETTPFYHNFPDGGIKFYNIPKEASLKIFTVYGDVVWETYHSDPGGENGIISWDTKNKHGREVGSGIYIFRCERGDGEDVYGRVIIIR